MKRDIELERYTYTTSGSLRTSIVHPIVRVMTRLLWVSGLVVIIAFLVAPWQQNIPGTGKVIAFAPTDRTQSIEAPIKGRIVEWHVQEGSVVEEGDPIAEIRDNDPMYGERLERERQAALDQLRATELSLTITQGRIDSLKSARDSAISNAELYVQIASDKASAAAQDLEAADAAFKTAELNFKRQKGLEAEGLTSTRKVELTTLKLDTSRSKLESAKAKLRAARREVMAARAKLENIRNKEQSYIAKAEEAMQKMQSSRAKAQADVAKAEVKVARQQSMSITAPVAGTVLRLVTNGPGHFVKAGDMVAQIVPSTASRAVELWIEGNDAPLITAGRHVRIQFEGWPAVQFVGWPAVAVGTFGGEVAFVDATDDGTGRFRIVVVPDESDDPWPDAQYLRQGVRANGWVMLNRVTIAFELWRQLNGFPPAVTPPSKTGSKGDKGKKKK